MDEIGTYTEQGLKKYMIHLKSIVPKEINGDLRDGYLDAVKNGIMTKLKKVEL